jgi:acyl dehydratase
MTNDRELPGSAVAEIVEWYADRTGEHLGYSAWHEITQADVNGFADATRDWQWIHTSPEKARNGPYSGPVAHGFLTLSLIPYLTAELLDLGWTEHGLNYRLDKVRFPAPVPVGARVRGGAVIRAARLRPRDYVELTLGVSIEIEGAPRPACTADHVRLYRAATPARLPDERFAAEADLDPRPAGSRS